MVARNRRRSPQFHFDYFLHTRFCRFVAQVLVIALVVADAPLHVLTRLWQQAPTSVRAALPIVPLPHPTPAQADVAAPQLSIAPPYTLISRPVGWEEGRPNSSFVK